MIFVFDFKYWAFLPKLSGIKIISSTVASRNSGPRNSGISRNSGQISRPIVYFSMYFSRNSGITRYSGRFATDGPIHYYERRLYTVRPCDTQP